LKTFALRVAGADEEILHPLAIHFHVPVDAARRSHLAVFERGPLKLRLADDCQPVRGEARQHALLQLAEGGDSQVHRVVEESDAAAHHRAPVSEGREGEAEARREVVLA
jgi:hypothetical protein